METNPINLKFIVDGSVLKIGITKRYDVPMRARNPVKIKLNLLPKYEATVFFLARISASISGIWIFNMK